MIKGMVEKKYTHEQGCEVRDGEKEEERMGNICKEQGHRSLRGQDSTPGGSERMGGA